MLNLLKAFRPVAVDLFSTILFVAFYAITGSIVWATALGIAAGIMQIGWLKWRGRPVVAMQWMSLGLVIVLGSITLFLNDPRFIMVKPSIATFAIGLVMLKPNWMGRYMPPIVTENLPASVPVVWGYIWSGAMFALSAANLFVALTMSTAAWAWFNGTVPLVLQLSLFVIQYVSIRVMVRRALKAKAENPPDALLAD